MVERVKDEGSVELVVARREEDLPLVVVRLAVVYPVEVRLDVVADISDVIKV